MEPMAVGYTQPANEQVGELFVIGKEDPYKDYVKLIDTNVAIEGNVSDKVIKENFRRISSVVQDVIWSLLFDADNGDPESQEKAAKLLDEHRCNACFFGPWGYNEWIVKLRDELLKRQQIDFWRDVIVSKNLGPCWSRDSDLFDGDDEPPFEFYAHAGCIAPFAAGSDKQPSGANQPPIFEANGKSDGNSLAMTEAERTAAITSSFDATLGLEDPTGDYRSLIKRYVLTDAITSDETYHRNFEMVAQAAHTVIWRLLFEGTPTQVEFDKAADMLSTYKSDARYYDPWAYNAWIVKVRDELLSRNMISFWRDVIVKREFGPCCYRDSDYFDAGDGLPLDFYNKAGCTAPFTSN